MNSKFSNWQLFKAPIGLAMTNSPIERYKRDIKESFTKRIRFHLKSSVELFKDVVYYESVNSKVFKTEPEVRKYTRVQAKSILTNKQLIQTESSGQFLYKNLKKI